MIFYKGILILALFHHKIYKPTTHIRLKEVKTMFKVAPLHSSLMLFSMLGFIISAFFISNPLVKTWAWAFIVVFVLIFISSVISMSNLPIKPHDRLHHLAIHTKGHYKKRK